jgi:hypothetical protein
MMHLQDGQQILEQSTEHDAFTENVFVHGRILLHRSWDHQHSQ